MVRKGQDEIRTLKNMAEQPTAQTAFAIELLRPTQGRDVLMAALTVLTRRPADDARPALIGLFNHFAERGPARDPGCFMRRAVLDAWRPVALPADRASLLQAVNTYEYLPPDFHEDAILLRAAALVVLAELDEEMARYHGVRLLMDDHTDPMSGEPALTAAKVLASLDETVVLYSYAMRRRGVLPEVVSECLRSLTNLPDELLPDLLDLHQTSADAIVLVGLFDLLLNHRSGPHGRDVLTGYLTNGANLDAYRYLVITLIAQGDDHFVNAVLDAARTMRNPEKVDALADALAIRSGDPVVDAVLAQLTDRLRSLPGRTSF